MRTAVPESATSQRPRVPWWVGRERVILGTLSVAAPFVLWEVLSRAGILDARFVSSPSAILAAGIREMGLPRFWRDLATSAFEFATGYLAAILLGVPLGIVLGWYRRLAYFFDPLVNFLYAVPRVALLPVIVLWLGLTVWSKVAVVFLGAWITILLNTYLGVRTVDRALLGVALSFDASQRKIFTSVVLPGSVPFILAGLRLGIGRALIGVVVGELYAANAGLGFMITVATNNLQVDRVLFGAFLFILFGVVAVEALRRVERRYAVWRQEVIRAT